jgi:hypothetical protein
LPPVCEHSRFGSNQRAAHHPQGGQRNQREVLRRVLLRPTVANRQKSDLAFNNLKRVLRLRQYAGVRLFCLIQPRIGIVVFVQRTTLSWAQGYVSGHTRFNDRAVVESLVLRVTDVNGLFAVQQDIGLCDLADLDRGTAHSMHQFRVCIDSGMGFHTKVPLVVFFAVVHVTVARFVFVLGGCEARNQGGVPLGVSFQEQAALGKNFIDGG